MKILLKGAEVYRNGRFAEEDIIVEDGVIAALGADLDAPDAQAVVLKGFYVVPGFVDVHVHLREPGYSYKETITSGTMAAARGGYTTVCSMPNLNPAPDNLEHLQVQLDMIREGQVVKVVPYGTITEGQRGGGRLADMKAMAPYVVGFTDDGRGVQTTELMEQAMKKAKELDKPIVAHCEVEELLKGGYIHDGEYARANGHKGISSESEWRQVERDIELVRRTGCRYHVCHVSTKESVALIRAAKAEGLPVTCETAPHYLLLTDADLQEDGRFKMNPPIRSSEDRDALIEGIKDGTVDMIATDHAPHSAEEKSHGLSGSAMGIVGLETSFALLHTYLVKEGVITLERLVELMSVVPGRVFGLSAGIEVGEPADLAVLDLAWQWAVDPEEFVSMGHATPFDGWNVQGRNEMTMVNGKVVYRNFGCK